MKKKPNPGIKANVALVSALTPLLQSEKGKADHHHIELILLAFASGLKVSTCPGLIGLHLLLAAEVLPRQGLSLVQKCLCTAGAWLIFPSGTGGEGRCLLEWSECCLPIRVPAFSHRANVVKHTAVDLDDTLFLHLRSFLSLKQGFSQWII